MSLAEIKICTCNASRLQ